MGVITSYKWGSTLGGSEYGTGTAPTDFTAGDGTFLYCRITSEGIDYDLLAYIRQTAISASAVQFLEHTVGASESAYDVSALFSGGGITYALDASSAALPTGATLSTAGIISAYTPDTEDTFDLVIRGTSTSGTQVQRVLLTVVSAAAAVDLFGEVDDTLLSAYTGESGYSWANMGSNNAARIISNALVPNSNAASCWAYDTTAVTAAQIVSADFEYIADSSNNTDHMALGLLCRSGGTGGYGVFVNYNVNNQYWALYEVASGESYGLLGTWADGGFDVAAQTRAVELRQVTALSGGIADWEVWIDGTLRISALNVEDHSAGGTPGVKHKGVSGRTINMSIDNFAWAGGTGGEAGVITANFDLNTIILSLRDPNPFEDAVPPDVYDLNSYGTTVTGATIVDVTIDAVINATPASDITSASAEGDTFKLNISVTDSSSGTPTVLVTNEVTVLAAASPPAPGAQHTSHLEYYGRAADTVTPMGFSIGDHYIPEVADGAVVIEPGRNHEKIYAAASGGWTLASIEAIEGGTITNAWILAQSFYGRSEAEPLEKTLAESVWASLIPEATGARMEGVSHWLLLERDGTYSGSELLRKGRVGESPLHPILVAAWGTGAKPIITERPSITYGTEPTDNLAFSGLQFDAGFSLKSQGSNVLLAGCDILNDELTFDSGNYYRITVFDCKLLDSWRDVPTKGKDNWLDAYKDDRVSAMHPDDHWGLYLKDCIVDHGGWNATYAQDATYNAGLNGQPPTVYSHGVYLSARGAFVTMDGCIVTRAANSGAQWRTGGHMMNSVYIDNNIGFQLGGPDQTNWGGFNCNLDNLVTQAGHKTINIGTNTQNNNFTGKIANGVNGGKDVEPTVSQLIVCHADNPNALEGFTGNQPTSVTPTLAIEGALADYKVRNWLNKPDENVEGLSTIVMDAKTSQYYADLLRVQPQGTSTVENLIEYFRGLPTVRGASRAMWEWFADGFGYSYPTRTGTNTNTFVPWISGEGWRWDNKRNWSQGFLPGEGDTVMLDGNFVTTIATIRNATIDLGTSGELRQFSGLTECASLNGSGTVSIEGAGQVLVDAVGTGAKQITLQGGRLGMLGTVIDNLSIAAYNGSEVLFAPGSATTIGAGKTLAIHGGEPFVGFDGTSGSASLTMNATANLNFTSTAKFIITGLTTVNSGKNAPKLGATMTGAISGATGIARYVKIIGSTCEVILSDLTDTFTTGENITGQTRVEFRVDGLNGVIGVVQGTPTYSIGQIAEFTSGKYGSQAPVVASTINCAGNLTVSCVGMTTEVGRVILSADTISGTFGGTVNLTGCSNLTYNATTVTVDVT